MSYVVIIGSDEMRANVLEINIFEVDISSEKLSLIFEVYNRMFDSYKRSLDNDDHSYLKLNNLKSHLDYAKKVHQDLYKTKKLQKDKEFSEVYQYLNAINQDGRYDLILEYFNDYVPFKLADYFKEIIYDHSLDSFSYHFIDNEEVDDEVYDGYLFQGLYHYYEIMEYYDKFEDLGIKAQGFDLDDFLNHPRFKDLLDLSQGF